MLRKTQEMEGMKLVGVDESIGKLHDFYFDDDTWIIRYLVADVMPPADLAGALRDLGMEIVTPQNEGG